MPYRIFTDAMCDLPVRFAQVQNVSIIPRVFEMDGRFYRYRTGESEVSLETVYSSYLAGTAVQTCSINSKDFIEAFEPVLQEGEDILYIGISSGLSETYQSANEAVRELETRYPERSVRVINSTCVSLGEGLLVLHAARRQRTLELDALADWIETNKGFFAHRFVLDNIHSLRRGGRVTAFTAAFFSFFRIRQFCHLNSHGHLTVGKKVIGRKRSLLRLVDSLVQTVDMASTDTVFIGHCDARADAEFVASLVREKYPDRVLQIESIGLNVGLLFGPGTIALFFVGNER